MKRQLKSGLFVLSDEPAALACPACELCAGSTRLVGLERVAHSKRAELFTYECSNCGHAQASVNDRERRPRLVN